MLDLLRKMRNNTDMESKTPEQELNIKLTAAEVFDAGRAATVQGFETLPDFVRAALLEATRATLENNKNTATA